MIGLSKAEFKRDHLFESQYLTVYLKCQNKECCAPFRSKVDCLFPHRQIPPLIPIEFAATGPSAIDLTKDLSDQKLKFPTFVDRIVFGSKLVPIEVQEKYGSRVPYDICVPTIKDKNLPVVYEISRNG